MKYTRKPFPGFNPDGPWTPIDNDVIDFLMALLSSAAFKIYLVMLREQAWTAADVVALSYAEIGRQTGIKRSQVFRTVWLLQADRLIDIERQTRADGGSGVNHYRILPLPAEVYAL